MGFDKIDATKKLEKLEALRAPPVDSRREKPMAKPGKLPPKPVDTVAEEEEPVNTDSWFTVAKDINTFTDGQSVNEGVVRRSPRLSKSRK